MRILPAYAAAGTLASFLLVAERPRLFREPSDSDRKRTPLLRALVEALAPSDRPLSRRSALSASSPCEVVGQDDGMVDRFVLGPVEECHRWVGSNYLA
jgi:hypothetical protein